MKRHATTTKTQTKTTALAPILKMDTTAMVNASLMPMKMESATSSKSLDVLTQQHATTTQRQPTKTDRASLLKMDTTAMVTAS